MIIKLNTHVINIYFILDKDYSITEREITMLEIYLKIDSKTNHFSLHICREKEYIIDNDTDSNEIEKILNTVTKDYHIRKTDLCTLLLAGKRLCKEDLSLL